MLIFLQVHGREAVSDVRVFQPQTHRLPAYSGCLCQLGFCHCFHTFINEIFIIHYSLFFSTSRQSRDHHGIIFRQLREVLVQAWIPLSRIDRASLRSDDGFHMSVWEPFSTYHAGDGLKQRIGFIMQCHCSKSLRVSHRSFQIVWLRGRYKCRTNLGTWR